MQLNDPYLKTLSLEKALRYYLWSLTGGRPPRSQQNAILSRLGFDGHGPTTLEFAGNLIGVTRERIRQVEGRVKKLQQQDGLPTLPQLQTAIALLRSKTPLAASSVPRVLRLAGVTGGDFQPRAVIAVADFFRHEHRLVLTNLGGREVLVWDGDDLGTGRIQRTWNKAKSLARRGIFNLVELKDELEDDGLLIDERRLRKVVRLNTLIRVRDDGWFWFVGVDAGAHHGTINVTQKMLAVSSTISVSSLREGMRRRVAYRKRGAVPPLVVLEDFYRSRPEFHVDEHHMVSSTLRLKPSDHLSDVEQIMVEILKAAPDGIMDRSSFVEACRRRGLNLSTVGVFTTYNPVLERVAHNVWSARGTRVGPVVLDAFQAEHSERGHPIAVATWGAEGKYHFSLPLTISQLSSGIVSLPAGATFLFGRAFTALTIDGRPAGTINSDDRTSWGWGSFFRRSGAEPGDFLCAIFDIAAGRVDLQLGGPELMDTEGSMPINHEENEAS